MPRLLKIIGGIIAAAAVVTIVPSNRTEHGEPVDIFEFRNSIAQYCTWLKLQEANHITKGPYITAVTIPRPCEQYELFDQTARVCETLETAIILPQAVLALFQERDSNACCTTTSEKPASVSAALTAKCVLEEPTLTSTLQQNTKV